MLPRMFQLDLQFPHTDESCLYWKDGNIHSGSCHVTKPVVCCQESSFQLDQGKK